MSPCPPWHLHMEKQKLIMLEGKLVLGLTFLMLVTKSMAIQNDKEDDNFKIIGCLPGNQKFIVSPYFEKEYSLDVPTFDMFLATDFSSLELCPWLQESTGHMFQLSNVHRQLIGEGSHRHLITSIVYEAGNAISRLDADFCRAVIVERLPAGIFADPFELQHLVQHGAFIEAAVFGDKNLELPSALSNRTVVEIHMDLQHTALFENSKGSEFTVKLPLHVRYPPLDAVGYSRVVMGKPDILIYCRPGDHSEDSFLPVMHWNATSLSDNIEWWIPCGNEDHARIVTAVTFLSALVFSLLIVYFSVSYSPLQKDTKLA